MMRTRKSNGDERITKVTLEEFEEILKMHGKDSYEGLWELAAYGEILYNGNLYTHEQQ